MLPRCAIFPLLSRFHFRYRLGGTEALARGRRGDHGRRGVGSLSDSVCRPTALGARPARPVHPTSARSGHPVPAASLEHTALQRPACIRP